MQRFRWLCLSGQAKFRRRDRSKGFTLLELIVVVGILAVLAAILIPNLANMRRPAQTTVEATTIGDLQNQMSRFELLNEWNPNRLDSLMEDNSTPYSLMNPDLFTGKEKLKMQVLTNDTSGDWYKSFKKGFDWKNSGGPQVMWHDPSEKVPSNSGVIVHAVVDGDTLPALNDGSSEGKKRIRAIFPESYDADADDVILPANIRTVVLGVGPSNTAIGKTMSAAPISPHEESHTYYRRYLAVFAIYADGSRARLKAILDRHGDTLDDTLRKVSEEGRNL